MACVRELNAATGATSGVDVLGNQETLGEVASLVPTSVNPTLLRTSWTCCREALFFDGGGRQN